MASTFEFVALCVATYAVSIPFAYVAAPLFKLAGLFPSADGQPSWVMTSVWPLLVINGIFLIPLEFVLRLHSRAQIFADNKEGSPGKIKVSDSTITNIESKNIVTDNSKDLGQICPLCKQTVKTKRESSVSNGAKS